MAKRIEPISVRVTRLNQLILGNGNGNKISKTMKDYINRESLLDSLVLLYNECEKEPLKKRDKNIAEFVLKYRSLIEEANTLRVNVNDFNIKAIIGKGYFGNVHLVNEKATGDIYAMKKVKKSVVTTSQIREERDIMAKRCSEWLTNLQYAFQDSDYLYLVMEYLPGGDLLSLMIRNGAFEEDLAKFYLAELTLAINDLHKLGYVHRDLKPENILIDRFGHIKLADFGNAATLNKDGQVISLSPVGTPDYIAPELLQTISSFKISKSTHDVTCDYWSMGIIGYELIYETTPFHEENVHETYSKILSHSEDSHVKEIIVFPVDVKITNNFKNLIENLITKPKLRLSYNTIRKHKFFDGVKWDSIRQEVPPIIPNVNGDDDVSNFEDIDRNKGRRSTFIKKPTSHNIKSNDFCGKDLPFLGYGFVHEDKITTDNIPENNNDAKIIKLNSKIKDLQIVMKSQADEIHCLQENLLKAEQKAKKSDSVTKIFNDTKEELNNMKERLKAKTIELASCKTEIKTLQSSLKIEEEMRVKSDATISEVLSSTYKKWEKAKSISDQNYEKQIADKKTETSTIAQKLSACENELISKSEECVNLQEKIENYKDMLKTIKEQSLKDKKEFEKNKQLLADDYEKKLIELKNKLRLEKDSRNRLTAELRDTRNELDDTISSSNNNKQAKLVSEKNFLELKQRLSREIEMNNNLRSETTKMEKLRNEIEKSVDNLKSENDKLKQELQLLECTKNLKFSSALSSPYATAHGSLTELHTVEEQLRNELLAARDNEDIQRKRAEKLESAVAKLEEIISKLTEQPKSVDDLLEKQNEKLEDKLASAREQMIIERQSARTANLSVWKLEKQIDDLHHEKRMIDRRMNLTEEKIKKIQNEKTEIDQALKESRNNLKLKDDRINELKDEIVKLKVDINKEHNRWEKAEQERMKEKSEVLEQLAEVHKLESQLHDTKQKLQQYKHKNEDLTFENKRLLQEIHDEKEQNSVYHEVVTELRNKLKSKEDNYEMLKLACNITDTQLSEVEVMLEKETEQNKQAQEKIKSLYSSIREKDNIIAQLRKDINLETANKIEAESKLKNLNMELEELHQNLEMSQTKMISQQNQLIECTNNLFMTQEKVELLSNESVNLQLQNTNYNKEITILKEENSRILTDLFYIKEEGNKLQINLKESNQYIIELKEEIQNLESTLSEQKSYYTQREIKSEATLSQHKKLIDYLQLKVEDLTQHKKKKTLADMIFGGSSNSGGTKENISPNIVEQSILYRTLQEELKREKTKSKTLQEQLDKYKNEVIEIKKSTSPTKNNLIDVIEHIEKKTSIKQFDTNVGADRGSLTSNSEKKLQGHRFELTIENTETMPCTSCQKIILCGSPFWKCKECKCCVHRKCRGNISVTCDGIEFQLNMKESDTHSISTIGSFNSKDDNEATDFAVKYHGDFLFDTDINELRLEINCAIEILDRILLLGCNSGLFAYNKDLKTLVNITGISNVNYIAVTEKLYKAILIGSNREYLYQCDLRHLQNRSQANACLKPKLEASILDLPFSNRTETEKWRLIEISNENDNAVETIAVAATSNRIVILKYDLKIQRFKPMRVLDTATSVLSVLFTRHTAIVCSDKFFEIDLTSYTAEEFVDLSDSRLQHVQNCQPVNAFRISSQEFLLCFTECGIFVDEYGCKSRPYDINWDYTPTGFLYHEPFLYISHFQFVQIIRLYRSFQNDITNNSNSSEPKLNRVYVSLYMPTLLTGGNNICCYVLTINKEVAGKQEIYYLNPLNPILKNMLKINSNLSLETLSSEATCKSLESGTNAST